MNAKTLRGALPAFALLLAAGACESGLTEANKNPNSPEEVPVEYILASGIWDAVGSNTGVGSHGEWTMLYHTSLWAQHISQAQYNDEDHYVPRPGIPTQVWDVAYAGSLTDLLRVKQEAAEAGNDNLWAVAEIMSVYQFLMLTDLYGDIPYSEALSLDKEIQNPKYDKQETIYPDLWKRLAAAVAKINNTATAFDAGDLVYGGEMQGWREFGNSLRLRIAMRVADTSLGAQAKAEFEAAWAADKYDNVADAADLDWEGAQPAQNPLHEQIILGGRTGDFRVSSSLTSRLASLNDPRLAIYADPAQSDGVIRGLPNGLTPDEVLVNGDGGGSGDFSWIGERFLEADAPSVLMSYAEMLFLGAEAAARGWNVGATAASLYQQGITASMAEHGVSAAAIATYLAQPSVAYAGNNATGRAQIGTQKWFALYMAGPEAFNEFRRTGYPALQLSAHAELDDFPARMPYPTEEKIYNPTNYVELDLTAPVWWMK